ncbi:MAG: hypothetical protein ACMXX8_00145 [Candidatus Woesearchaeota archaeon]
MYEMIYIFINENLMILLLLGLIIVLLIVIKKIFNLIRLNKEWKKSGDFFDFNYINKKNIIIPDDLKEFILFNNYKYNYIILNLKLEGELKGFKTKIYKYFSLGKKINIFKCNNKILLFVNIDHKLPKTLIIKKRLFFNETVYFKDFFSSINPENYYLNEVNKKLVVFCDKNSNFEKSIIYIKDLCNVLSVNFPFERIEIINKKILFVASYKKIKKLYKIIKKSEFIVSYLTND